MKLTICNFHFAVASLLAVCAIGCDQRSSAKTAPLDATAIHGGGVIRGRIILDGPPPVMNEIRNQPCCDGAPTTLSEETVVIGANGGLANTFVYLEGLPRVNGQSLAPPLLDQVGCRYAPHTVGVCVGQPLRIRTSDATMHNVHFSPARNESRNFGMISPGDEKSVTFREPEFIRVKCDVHPWMTAYVGVFENPCFAVTDGDGTFELANLPAGKYKLVTWHERYGRLEQDVEVNEAAPLKVDLKYAAPNNQ
ncbi:methylamine utilization protein [soil metagenome]